MYYDDDKNENSIDAKYEKVVDDLDESSQTQKTKQAEFNYDSKTFIPNSFNISILLSVISIVFVIVTHMFAYVSNIAAGIFFWIGAGCLLGALGLYISQLVKGEKLKFEPQLILILVAVICCCM